MKESLLIFVIPCFIFLGIFIYVQNKHKYVLSTTFKGLASICFFLIPVVGLSIESKRLGINFDLNQTILVYIGLGLGLIGDILLNLRDLFSKPIKNYISLGGIISFLLGHIFYLIHLFMISNKLSISIKNIYIPILFALVIACAISIFVFNYVKGNNKFKIGACFYILIVSLITTISIFNYISTFSVYVSNSRYFITMFVGCLGFASSDVILIFNSFGYNHKKWLSAINLALYYASQILIATSIILFYI